MHDAGTIRRIVHEACVQPGDRVLEIGPGLGSLTLGLLEAGAVVSAVEIDAALARALPETVAWQMPGTAGRLAVVRMDAMDVKSPADLAVPVELAGSVELAGPSDLAGPEELAGSVELAVPVELAGSVELAGPSDLAGPEGLDASGELLGAGGLAGSGDAGPGDCVGQGKSASPGDVPAPEVNRSDQTVDPSDGLASMDAVDRLAGRPLAEGAHIVGRGANGDGLAGQGAAGEVIASQGIAGQGVAGPAFQPLRLVANLPYNVAVPILLTLFEALPSIRTATVMVQAEVADRLAAQPGSRTYGVPSVKAAWYAQARRGSKVSRSVFWPVPNVDSALVSFTRRPAPVGAAREDVFAVVDAAFSQRRKTLRSALASWAGGAAKAEEILRAAGVQPSARGETLAVEDFAAIAKARQSLAL